MDNAVGPAAGANPFKVYSVASLDDLAADIESEAITVRTPAIELARTAVENY